MTFSIITCPTWGAVKPSAPLSLCGKSSKIIFHHTAGHHAEISVPQTESVAESEAYARSIQHFHMEINGWNDSGHNFLVCRNGVVLQGRWLTVSRIEEQGMVISAHCPGQNNQIGIEHEHISGEKITTEQFEASAQLQAWIANKYHLSRVLPVFPHSYYFATACPDNLVVNISGIKNRAQTILNQLNAV